MKIHPPSILRIVIILASACLASPPLPSFAGELIMVSPAVGADEVADFAEALAAEGKSLTPNDDLVINGKFAVNFGSTSELTLRNLTLQQFKEGSKEISAALYLGASNASLTVRGNIRIQCGILAVQGSSLEWGGMLEFGSEGKNRGASFEMLINISKVKGRSMTATQNGNLVFRAFDKRAINGMKNNPDLCGLVLDGEVQFTEGALLTFSFDKAGMDLDLPGGEYTLVSAKKISGTAPQLKMVMEKEPFPTERFSLRMEPTRLVLVVAE